MSQKLNGVRTTEDILLATPRTIGVVGNTANNLFNTLTNPITRGVNYLNDRYRKSIERVTTNKFAMKEYTDLLENTPKGRFLHRWGKTKTRWANKFKQLGNIGYKGLGVVKSALWTVPLAWNMTVTNVGDTLKDTGSTIGGALHDIGKAVVAPADQGPNKQPFQFTKVQRDRLAWLQPVNNPTPRPTATEKTPPPAEKPIDKPVKKEEPAPEKPAPEQKSESKKEKDDADKTVDKKPDSKKVDADKVAAKTYSGLVSKTPQPNQVFVFGSNQLGAHGGGNAKFAAEYWDAEDGNPEGLQGQSYGIVTTIKKPDPNKDGDFINTPNTPLEIINQIKKLYTFAKENPKKELLIGYTEKGGVDGKGSSDQPMLSGYSPIALASLFAKAVENDLSKISSNIIFNDKFAELVYSGKKKA